MLFIFSDFSKASPLVNIYRKNILEDYDYTNDSLFWDIRSHFKVSISSKH